MFCETILKKKEQRIKSKRTRKINKEKNKNDLVEFGKTKKSEVQRVTNFGHNCDFRDPGHFSNS